MNEYALIAKVLQNDHTDEDLKKNETHTVNGRQTYYLGRSRHASTLENNTVLIFITFEDPPNVPMCLTPYSPLSDTKRIYDRVEAETRKSQESFQIIQDSSEALPRMRLE